MRAAVTLAAAAWFGLSALAWVQLYRHAFRPEPTTRPVAHWPGGAPVGGPAREFQIVMFVHPLCPCTRAGLQELDESLTRLPESVSPRVVVVTAGLPEADVLSSPSLTHLRRMPRVELNFDATGDEARRFGASVSGEVFGFNRAGARVYHGGLTPARGHQGDAVGQRQLEELARGEAVKPCEAPVFGCRLPGLESLHPSLRKPERGP